MEKPQVPVVSAFGAFSGEIFAPRDVENRPVPDAVAMPIAADRQKRIFHLRHVPVDVLQNHAAKKSYFKNRLGYASEQIKKFVRMAKRELIIIDTHFSDCVLPLIAKRQGGMLTTFAHFIASLRFRQSQSERHHHAPHYRSAKVILKHLIDSV